MYQEKPYSANWMQILEDHFHERRKAFLVFDSEHQLVHISDYAREILEINESQIGIMTLIDIFPGEKKNPDLIVGSDYNFQKVHDVTYTTPSGRQVEIRLNIDQIKGGKGFLLWLEHRSRDITGTYRKISSLEPYREFVNVFNIFNLGFMLLDRNGVIIEHNEDLKKILRLPGEWEGRNIFTFPPLHNNKLSDFIRNSISGKKKSDARKFKIKYSSTAAPVQILLSGTQISDLTGSPIGAIISCRSED